MKPVMTEQQRVFNQKHNGRARQCRVIFKQLVGIDQGCLHQECRFS
jgi:hypothetical protein